ncbi:MAG: GHKL domain-containing protein [Spirulina sp. SIO3F2]|nr:GHKL domain-containing protein [Spirulina sp. SIO3F2]
MPKLKQQVPQQLKQYAVVVAIAISGVLLTSFAAFRVRRWEHATQQERFEHKATDIAGRLQAQVDDYAQLTRSMGALYQTSEQTGVDEFRALSRTLLPYAEGLAGFGWLAWQADDAGDGGQFANLALELRYSDVLINPERATDPSRQFLLEKVAQLGVPVTTPLLTLETGQPGFVLYQPVFSSNAADSTEPQLRGVVFGLYSLESWVQNAIATLDLQQVSFSIYQIPVDQLESALLKPQVKASENFIAAYDTQRQTLTTDMQFAALDAENAVPTSEVVCPYSDNWTVCMRSIHMEGRELALLLRPAASSWWLYRNSITVLVLGYGLTLSLALYLGRSQQQALRMAHQNQELEQVLHKLKQTQTQLVQTEKMSSLGQLVAGIAHEINNPMTFIAGNIQCLHSYVADLMVLIQLYETTYPQPSNAIVEQREEMELDFIVADLDKLMQSIASGSQRVSEIVQSMRNFSRLDEAAVKSVDIHSGLESTLLILNSRLKAQDDRQAITVHKQYGELPRIKCYAGQLNQVFMNILSNAIDAIAPVPDPHITITTRQHSPEWIEIAIANNGPSISPEIQSRLFEPFFTTKPVGQGTGLGLSISYQVITEHHGGQLYCESEPGKGTQFVIILPIQCSVPELTIEGHPAVVV